MISLVNHSILYIYSHKILGLNYVMVCKNVMEIVKAKTLECESDSASRDI